MAGVLPRRDGHSSGTPVAGRLKQPTRATRPTDRAWRASPRVAPIRFCSRRGLPCRRRCRLRGALLPHPFTLTRSSLWPVRAVCFLWRYPWGRPRRTLSGAASVWSPDFPPPFDWLRAAAVRPTGALGHRSSGRRRSRRKQETVYGMRCQQIFMLVASIHKVVNGASWNGNCRDWRRQTGWRSLKKSSSNSFKSHRQGKSEGRC